MNEWDANILRNLKFMEQSLSEFSDELILNQYREFSLYDWNTDPEFAGMNEGQALKVWIL
jgi:hypothetical protein